MSDKIDFDKQSWTERFAGAIFLELSHWRGRVGVDKLRAFAVLCHPWEPAVASLSFLTDRELSVNEEKWDIAAWRLYSFQSSPYREWPDVMELLEEANKYWEWEQENGDGDRARDDIIDCCVAAVKDQKVQNQLSRYQKAEDFEIWVGIQEGLTMKNRYKP